MSGVTIAKESMAEFQRNLLRLHKCGVGKFVPEDYVRAAMVVRLNSLLCGVSGVRIELLQRLEAFLNAGITPCVPQHGSIGASGDLVPLNYLAGSIVGSDSSFLVNDQGDVVSAPLALHRHGWPPLELLPKEGLSLINGSCFSAGMAALQVYDVQQLIAVTFGVHALALQAVRGFVESFSPFIHENKPHRGQVLSARLMREMLAGSNLVEDRQEGWQVRSSNRLIQDRYSLRCIPQYLGPLVETISETRRWIETEMNSSSDNPLIDSENSISYHGGNFLSQYIGISLDRLRHVLGLAGKHLDIQIGWLMHPDFSNGLPASLVGNPNRQVNMGMKGVQLTSNSLAPLLLFNGQSFVDRFVTHAEQFNQNLNSQSFGAALLTHQSLDLFKYLLATSLLVCVQAVDLRVQLENNVGDARSLLSPKTAVLYEAVYQTTGRVCRIERPYVFDDDEFPLDKELEAIAKDLAEEGSIVNAVAGCHASLAEEFLG